MPSDRRDPSVPSDRRDWRDASVPSDRRVPSDWRDASVPSDWRDASVPRDWRDASVPSDRRDPSVPSDRRDASNWGASSFVSRRGTGYCLENLRRLESHRILCRPECLVPLPPVFRCAFRRATLMERPLSGFIVCVDMCVFCSNTTFFCGTWVV